MKNYYEDGAAMLDDYLSGYIILCDTCPVNNIEQYETGKYQHTAEKGSCTKAKARCYELADRIVNIRDYNDAKDKGVSIEDIRNARIHD